MNPIGALYIAEAIEDERRRFIEQRRLAHEARSRANDASPTPSGHRSGWSSILRFRPFQAAESRG
jgi:hypothetical protein